MNGLLIIGAGGHGKVVADAAMLIGWSDIAFLDDRFGAADAPLGIPIIGRTSDMEDQRRNFQAAVVAVGDARQRLALLDRCTRSGFDGVIIVHPSASVSRFAHIGAGSVVFAQAAINADARLGIGCIVNTGATIDHDCTMDAGVHVCPGAHLAGSVSIGTRSWVGIGAAVRQQVTIGRDVTIGAGAVVVADVPDGATVVGVPARPTAGMKPKRERSDGG